MPTRKASLLVCVAKAAAKDGRERRDGAVHQSSEAGLNNLEDEAAALGLVFLVACAGGLLPLIHFLGEVVVLALLRGEIPEQLTHPGVARLRDGGLIKIARLLLHHFSPHDGSLRAADWPPAKVVCG